MVWLGTFPMNSRMQIDDPRFEVFGVLAHVSPSMPGAADFFKSKNWLAAVQE